jgi:hypothetical protein
VEWGAAKGVLEELCTAPQFTKMVKSSMFAALIGLIQLANLIALQLAFLR